MNLQRRRIGQEQARDRVAATDQATRRLGGGRERGQIRRRVVEAGGHPWPLVRRGLAHHPNGERRPLDGRAPGRLGQRQQAGAPPADLDEGRPQAPVDRRHPTQVDVAQQARMIVALDDQVGQPAVLDPGGAQLARLD